MPGSEQVIRNLEAAIERRKAKLKALGEHHAAKMEAYAKQNKPWENITHHAQQSLHGYCLEGENTIRVRIAHGVDYGIYLELANSSKYAILHPTAKKIAPEFFENAKRVVKGR